LRYTQADYQNLQRIAAKEKEQTRDYAITRFATDLLETVDVLNLALRSVPQEYGSAESDGSSRGGGKSAETVLRELVEGVSLTNKQLLSTLGKYGVTAFDPIGERFDPNRHEALYAAPVPGKAAGEVIETQKLGYMIKGRVLRAPQVGIVQEEA
jgi:molecular chaperone GrpE